MIAVLVVAAVAATLWFYLELTNPLPTPNAAPGPADPARVQACADRPACSVPFCEDHVVVHVAVGFERWPFCLEHGLRYFSHDEQVRS